MARIDRLQEAPKRTLQLASVIGREFTRRLLERIADIQVRTEELLQELKAIELIYEKSAFPELAYMFKHALTHEVAYNSLLMQRRQGASPPHRLGDRGALRGSAGRAVRGPRLSLLRKRRSGARLSSISSEAAEKATQAFANREALALYDQALEAVGHLGDAVDTKP